MKFMSSKHINAWVMAFLLTALLICTATAASFDHHGKGKGKGKGRGNSHQQSNQRKKDDKFVNGHDARNGRLDGRGPKHKH